MNNPIRLIGNFAHSGTGVATSNYSLLKYLIQTDLDLEITNLDSIAEILPKIPMHRKIAYSLFLHPRGKNIHFLDPDSFKQVKGAKIITTFYDLYVFDKRKRDFSIFGYLLNKTRQKKFDEAFKFSDLIMTISTKTKEDLIKRYGEKYSRKIFVINDIIDDKFFKTDKKIKNKNTVIGYINNFTWNKAEKLRVFIETFKNIKNASLRFNIYGKNFPFADLIKDDKRIRYLGFLPEDKIVQTLKEFDVYLSTSTIEGFGLPIMQAKACNVPVLCYDGDLPSIVKRNTLVWDDANLSEIIKGRLWENFDVEKASKDAEKCRSDEIIPKIIKVYNKVFT
ncbi:MAG: glycosyltransferase [Candidatus Parvarchaeota archaeon]|nr:glycosyltransferase [Candidatus Parvarchaeota archaeon]